jgi:MFS family permease
VLDVPAFRWYFAAMGVSAVGSSMYGLAVTFAVIGLGGSATQLGVVLAAGAVPTLLLTLVGGVAGDRLERRTLMMASDVVMAAVMGVLAYLLVSGHAHIWHLLVGEVVAGCAMAFSGPAAVGLMPTLVSEDLLQSANSLRYTTWNVASVFGPPLAGLLVAVGSPGWALGANGLTYAVSAVLMLRLPRSRGRVQAGGTMIGDLKEGWHAFTSRRWVVLMVASFASYQATVLPAIFVLGPILAQRHLDGASSWALVLSGRAVGSLVAGAALLRWRPRRPLVASTALVLLDVPFLVILALGLPLVVVVAAGALSAAGVMAADTIWESTLQTGVPGDVLSRVSSYDWFGSIMINPLGFALIGAVSGAVGVAPVLVAAMAVQVLVRGGLLASRPIRGVRRPEPTAVPASVDQV